LTLGKRLTRGAVVGEFRRDNGKARVGRSPVHLPVTIRNCALNFPGVGTVAGRKWMANIDDL
jgi:hypothetical protein